MVFEGNLSEKCMVWLEREMKKSAVAAGLISCGVISIPIILMGIFISKWELLFLLIPVTIVILAACTLSTDTRKNVMNNIPIKIEIGSTGLAMETRTVFVRRNMDDVKKVWDFGEWYQITFYFGYKNAFFICQKDLIKEGTIEEFEEMFADKLVRKSR